MLEDHREEDTADDNDTKKRKVSSVVPDFTAKVIDCHERGQLESLTVAELKSFLTSKRVKVGGRKKDLIQRVKDLLA